jgi:hypothetical protein
MCDIVWVINQNTNVKKRLAKYERTAGYNEKTGEVYMPAALFGGESYCMICLSFDGIDLLIYNKHLYCPVSWLKKEYPSDAIAIEKAAENIRELIRNQAKEVLNFLKS